MTPNEEGELRQLLWIVREQQKCAAKTKFYSAQAAQIHRGPHARRTPPKMSAYLCPWCGFYHLTSLKPRQVEHERRAA
ncbi:MAG TPA: hypothetical protein PKV98_13525 [Burkholderiaceae bacterium]|nr:hypothetical protein [Burkholderiaceae bacterium]